MTDFAALSLAQPPLPLPPFLEISALHGFSGRSNDAAQSHLPQFSEATLRFLHKLSPTLQKTALASIIKSNNNERFSKQKNKEKVRHNLFNNAVTVQHTPPATQTTDSSIFTPSRQPRTLPTEKTTTLQSATTTMQTTTENYFITAPAFYWNDNIIQDTNEARKYNSINGISSNVNRMGALDTEGGDIGEDAGIVLLVAIFNLLAVVVYAAHRHLTSLPSLPPRLLDWQVQKVLDELVLRVHSSRSAAQFLARAMPPDLTRNTFSSRSVNGFTSGNSLMLLNSAKSLLLKIASSPTASSTSQLPMGLYRPITNLYSTVSLDLQNFLQKNYGFENEARSLSGIGEEFPTWLQAAYGAAQLNAVQWDGVLRSLTILGRSRAIASSEALAGALMEALVSPEGTARSSDINSLTKAAIHKVKLQDQQLSNLLKSSVESGRQMRKMGIVENVSGFTGAGGEIGDNWGQRWFSLVTRLAPVALDATTLYARAHSEPTCLKSLLCSINFSWKKVGPLQAALTPLLR